MKKYLEEIKVIALVILALNTVFCLYYVLKERSNLNKQIQTITYTNQSLRRELDMQEEVNFGWSMFFLSKNEDTSLNRSNLPIIGLNAGDCVLEKDGGAK